MFNRATINFTLITIIIGFMIAVQFQTVKEPVVRDTRNIWDLREALTKELELESELKKEIHLNEGRINNYETEYRGSKEEALNQTLLELKKEAGLSATKGAGIILTIEPLYEAVLIGERIDSVSPEILKRLINELNMFGAKHISIDGERLINTTFIRDINGETKVGNHSLNKIPFEIHIIASDGPSADKLFDKMKISQSVEDFFIENLRVKISKPNEVTVSAYMDPIRVRYMEPVQDKGES